MLGLGNSGAGNSARGRRIGRDRISRTGNAITYLDRLIDFRLCVWGSCSEPESRLCPRDLCLLCFLCERPELFDNSLSLSEVILLRCFLLQANRNISVLPFYPLLPYLLHARESLELWLSTDDDLYLGPAERTERGLGGMELLYKPLEWG